MNRRVSATQVWCFLALVGLAMIGLCLPQDARSWGLAANTARLTAATCAVAVPLGTVLAVLLVRTDVPGRRLSMLALAWLLFIPLYLQVGAWQAGFGWQGWQTLAGLGPAWLDGWRGAVWVHAAAAVPWVALVVGMGLRASPAELEESALLDASPLEVFWRVTLRDAAPLLGAAVLWVAISVAGEIAVTDLFQIRTYAEELYTQMALEAAPGEDQLRVLPGIAVTGWMVLAGAVLVLRIAPRATQAASRPPLTFCLGAWRWPLAVLLAIAVALLIGLPLANLAWKSGVNVLETDVGRQRQWSLVKCASIIAGSPVRYGREIRASFVIGAAAATAAVSIGTVLAWLARHSRVATGALASLIVVGLALPGPVLGLSIIWAFNRPGWTWAHYLYDRTIAPPVAAQLIHILPLACLMLWYAFHTLSSDELEAAELDGASLWMRLYRIALPQRRSALAAAWLVAFAAAVGELGATILVVPPGVEPLSVRISGLLHYGVEDQVAGICLALALWLLVIGAALAVLAKRWLGTTIVGPGELQSRGLVHFSARATQLRRGGRG